MMPSTGVTSTLGSASSGRAPFATGAASSNDEETVVTTVAASAGRATTLSSPLTSAAGSSACAPLSTASILRASEPTARIHVVVATSRMPPRYGVDAASEPNDRMRACCSSEPPDLPSGPPITSTAALPLVRVSGSGILMYAISLHGSKSEYLVDLEAMFCAVPATTASVSGVRPMSAVRGAHMPGEMINEKNSAPVARSVTGGMAAAKPHGNLARMKRPTSIMQNVTAPVSDENWPMYAA
mmetsp:Transcript_10821/g.43814  ORF Transcript_10821/g.43814 Transcript_10821/m.43814 type:complete len:241 (-) Transcript_10821:882-1604(-)